ncbi:MAG TPA: UbiA family prenyltransferase [Micromonosporaceae bacterium]
MSQSVSGVSGGRKPAAFIRASHPEPAVAVTTVAALLAVGVGHDAAGVAAVTATVLASQLAIGWVNDALDAERDAAVGRTDKPVAAGTLSRRTVGWAGGLAALATPLAALTLTPAAVACAVLALASALLYDWPLKTTPVSVLPYAVSFGALPAFVVLALPGAPLPPAWLVAAAALLGAGGHFANVLPDLADDARTGVRGLPHRLGAAGSSLAAAALLAAATLTLVFGPPGPPSWVGLTAVAATAAVLLAGWYAHRVAVARGSRAVGMFRAVLVVAVIDVLLLLVGVL